MSCFSVWDIQNCGCAAPTETCSPCNIPAADLTLSWTNSLHGPGSCTLTYSSTTHAWTGSFLEANGVTTCNVTFKCLAGAFNLGITVGADGTCSTGINGLKVNSSTCSPFHISWGWNTSLSIACNDLQSDGYFFFIDG